MPKTRSRSTPKGSGQAKLPPPRPQSPTEQFATYTLDGKKKRDYDILQDIDNSDTKSVFLTLRLRSHAHKARYKALAQHHGWPKLNEEDLNEDAKGGELEPVVPQEGQPSEQPFASEADREALEDLNLVEPVHSEAAFPSERLSQHTEAEVSEDQHKGTEVTPSLQQATSTHTTQHPEDLSLQSVQARNLSPVDPEVARKEVEGLLSSANQSLDRASKSALDLFLKESTAKQLSQIPAPGLSPQKLETQDPVNRLVATQAHLEETDSITKRLKEPLRIDTSQALNKSGSLLLRDEQTEHRSLKRSRTPEPPSLTSGAPSAPDTPNSPSSRSPSRRASPAKPRGRPQKAQVPSSFAPPQRIVTFDTKKFPLGWFFDPVTMAPVRDPSDVSNKIKDVIQNLYDVQSQTHGFVPETQGLLIDKMAELTQSLSDLQRLTDRNMSPNNPVHNVDLAPEIVDYVDDGRNPDIFTRDFVELVQRGNAVVNGKKQAFRDFSQVYAKALKEGIGGVERGVDLVMENAGIELDDAGKEHGGKENGQKA